VSIAPPPPDGWTRSALLRGDTLAVLETELKKTGSSVRAEHIAAANGVPWPGRKTCVWARGVKAWVLAVGGRQEDVVRGQEDPCDSGRGYASFVEGVVINLPRGLRPPATSGVVIPLPTKKASKTALIVGAVAVAGAAAAALISAKPKTKGADK
jgi:hypothetical protein